jgi:hypothetical protein
MWPYLRKPLANSATSKKSLSAVNELSFQRQPFLGIRVCDCKAIKGFKAVEMWRRQQGLLNFDLSVLVQSIPCAIAKADMMDEMSRLRDDTIKDSRGEGIPIMT